MIGPKTSAKDGSVAIGGDNNAPIVNINVSGEANIHLSSEQRKQRELPSILATVITQFSKQGLSEYGRGDRRNLLPEVDEKLDFNNVPRTHSLITDWLRHGHLLESTYRGCEQQNPDARYLTRRQARVAYSSTLSKKCIDGLVQDSQRTDFARQHAVSILEDVVTSLVKDFIPGPTQLIWKENAELAVSLIVIDAVVECEVLERPPNAVTP